MENSQWRKVYIDLPKPMWGFTPIVSDGHVFIVGFFDSESKFQYDSYKIPIIQITRSHNQQETMTTKSSWITLTEISHSHIRLVPGSSPPVVVGGRDTHGMSTSDIKMYDDSDKKWWKIAEVSLSSPRSEVAIATINNNALVVIGGCTKGGIFAKSSSMNTVEMGQLETIKPSLIKF